MSGESGGQTYARSSTTRINVASVDGHLAIHFVGTGFSYPLRQYENGHEIMASEDELRSAADRVITAWSDYANAHGQVVSGSQSAVEERAKAFSRAMRFSERLANRLLVVKQVDTQEQTDFRQVLLEWAKGAKGPLVTQNATVLIPWQLVYLGDKLPIDDVPLEAAEMLLGMLTPIVYHPYIRFEQRCEEPERMPEAVLLSLAHDPPAFDDADKAFAEIQGLVRSVLPDAQLIELRSVPDHEKHLSGAALEHDLWIILSHAEEGDPASKRIRLKLEALKHVDAENLRYFAEGRRVLEIPTCVFLVACRSGAVGDPWDLPAAFFELGASSVIGAHTDVAAKRSLDLFRAFLERVSAVGTIPSRAIIEAQCAIRDVHERLHAILFAPAVAKGYDLN